MNQGDRLLPLLLFYHRLYIFGHRKRRSRTLPRILQRVILSLDIDLSLTEYIISLLRIFLNAHCISDVSIFSELIFISPLIWKRLRVSSKAIVTHNDMASSMMDYLRGEGYLYVLLFYYRYFNDFENIYPPPIFFNHRGGGGILNAQCISDVSFFRN